VFDVIYYHDNYLQKNTINNNILKVIEKLDITSNELMNKLHVKIKLNICL